MLWQCSRTPMDKGTYTKSQLTGSQLRGKEDDGMEGHVVLAHELRQLMLTRTHGQRHLLVLSLSHSPVPSCVAGKMTVWKGTLSLPMNCVSSTSYVGKPTNAGKEQVTVWKGTLSLPMDCISSTSYAGKPIDAGKERVTATVQEAKLADEVPHTLDF